MCLKKSKVRLVSIFDLFVQSPWWFIKGPINLEHLGSTMILVVWPQNKYTGVPPNLWGICSMTSSWTSSGISLHLNPFFPCRWAASRAALRHGPVHLLHLRIPGGCPCQLRRKRRISSLWRQPLPPLPGENLPRLIRKWRYVVLRTWECQDCLTWTGVMAQVSGMSRLPKTKPWTTSDGYKLVCDGREKWRVAS